MGIFDEGRWRDRRKDDPMPKLDSEMERRNLPKLLEVWREAERAVDRAHSAADAARRAAEAATAMAEAVSETARNAGLTLEAAERARSVAEKAMQDALAAVDHAGGERTTSQLAVHDAELALEKAREIYHEASGRKLGD